MDIWRFTTNWDGPYNTLVNPVPREFSSEHFLTDGEPKTWPTRPILAPSQEKRKKKQKPVGDISTLYPGSLVFSAKAYQVLHAYLSRFGQLLEAECEGAPCYFYNVTEVIACFDMEKSTINSSGGVANEVFDPQAVPKGESIFKDPRRVITHIYITAAAKEVVEQIIQEAGLTGAVFEKVT